MKRRAIITGVLLAFGLTVLISDTALAHCDSLDGPVVKAAQKALDTGQPAWVLIWVRPDDEAEIRSAFTKTLTVRALSPDARELADRHFFETVVRVHRAGEGAPYTGLKPAGTDLGPAIPAADQAIDQRSAGPVLTLLTKAMEDGLRARYEHVLRAKNFRPSDVDAGREYVKTYVEFIHYVERLYEAIATSAHGHFPETEREQTHQHK